MSPHRRRGHRVGWKWAAHMAGIVTLMDAVLVGAVGVLSRQPLGVPWRPQALRKPSCQGARGTFLSGGQSECEAWRCKSLCFAERTLCPSAACHTLPHTVAPSRALGRNETRCGFLPHLAHLFNPHRARMHSHVARPCRCSFMNAWRKAPMWLRRPSAKGERLPCRSVL